MGAEAVDARVKAKGGGAEQKSREGVMVESWFHGVVRSEGCVTTLETGVIPPMRGLLRIPHPGEEIVMGPGLRFAPDVLRAGDTASCGSGGRLDEKAVFQKGLEFQQKLGALLAEAFAEVVLDAAKGEFQIRGNKFTGAAADHGC